MRSDPQQPPKDAHDRRRVDDRFDDDRSTHRVAVTVFATAKGHDPLAAAVNAVMAVKSVIAAAGQHTQGGRYRLEIDGRTSAFAANDTYLVTEVHEVTDTGLALTSGYLRCEPTQKPYRPNGEAEL